ncbi:DUF4131 domain-containing protein [Pseudoroseomonas wenyumeiae]
MLVGGVAAHLPGAAFLHKLALTLPGALAAEWQRLPLWLPVAMGSGILLYFSLRHEPDLSALWLAAALILAAVLLAGWRPLAAWTLAMGAWRRLASAWLPGRPSGSPIIDLPNKAMVVEGVVEAVDPLPEGVRVTLTRPRLSGDGPELQRNLRIRLRKKDPLVPVPGDRLRIRSLVREPAPPAFPGGWDFQRGAYFQGLGGSGFAIGPAERLGSRCPHRPSRSCAA